MLPADHILCAINHLWLVETAKTILFFSTPIGCHSQKPVSLLQHCQPLTTVEPLHTAGKGNDVARATGLYRLGAFLITAYSGGGGGSGSTTSRRCEDPALASHPFQREDVPRHNHRLIIPFHTHTERRATT